MFIISQYVYEKKAKKNKQTCLWIENKKYYKKVFVENFKIPIIFFYFNMKNNFFNIYFSELGKILMQENLKIQCLTTFFKAKSLTVSKIKSKFMKFTLMYFIFILYLNFVCNPRAYLINSVWCILFFKRMMYTVLSNFCDFTIYFNKCTIPKCCWIKNVIVL